MLDFVSAYDGIEPLEAAKRLDSMFGLGLFDGDYKPTRTEGEAYRADRETVSSFLTEADNVFHYLCNQYNLAIWAIKNLPPKLQPDGSFTVTAFLDSCINSISLLEYHKEMMIEALNGYEPGRGLELDKSAIETMSEIINIYPEGADYVQG